MGSSSTDTGRFGSTRAYIGEGATVDSDDLSVNDATATNTADTDVLRVSIGLVASGANLKGISRVDVDVESYIGACQDDTTPLSAVIGSSGNLVGDVIIRVKSDNTATTNVNGGVGNIGVNGTEMSADSFNRVNTRAFVGNQTTIRRLLH